MALTTVSSDRLSTNVKNTNFTAAEKQDLTNDILPLAGQLGGNRNLIINGAMIKWLNVVRHLLTNAQYQRLLIDLQSLMLVVKMKFLLKHK